MPARQPPPTLAGDLRAWVSHTLGVAVAGARPLGSGASRRTWSLELADGRRLVLREDTGTGPVAGTPLTLTREAAVYRALEATPIPVPHLVEVHPDGRALVLAHFEGSDDLRAAPRAERAAAGRDYLAWLARLHRLDPDGLDLGPLRVPPGTSPVRHDLDLWQAIHDTRGGPDRTPAAALALAWLRGHPPPDPAPASLCHGDAGPGNFLHHAGRVTALLDWEFAHVGDPHDDLAWVAVRNQLLGRPLDVADAGAAWRAASGATVDADRLEYYRALVLARMLVSCDATLAWRGGDASDARVQAVLQPWLAVATLEALARAGCPPADLADARREAATRFAHAAASHVLGDPCQLDDLGALT